MENTAIGVFYTELEIAERRAAGSTEHATPPPEKGRHSRERVTFKKTNFTQLRKQINKFPCEARLKGKGEAKARERWRFLQETD